MSSSEESSTAECPDDDFVSVIDQPSSKDAPSFTSSHKELENVTAELSEPSKGFSQERATDSQSSSLRENSCEPVKWNTEESRNALAEKVFNIAFEKWKSQQPSELEYYCPSDRLRQLVNYIPAAMTDTVKIDVFCDSFGMKVHVTFDSPFEGIIYSKGYLNETACLYLIPPTVVTDFTFHIPHSECGTETLLLGSTSTSANTVVFQSDPVLKTSVNHVRKLSCGWNSHIRNAVRLTEEITSLFSDKNSKEKPIKIFMEIKKRTSSLLWDKDTKNIKIGDQMVVLVYIYNVIHARIINCEARDEQSSQNSTVVALLDASGCPLQPQIFGSFEFIRMNSSLLVAFSHMAAFRFSEKKNLYITCGIEICRNSCHTICPFQALYSAVPKTEFSKRSLTIPDISPRTEKSSPSKPLNDLTVRRFMKNTIDAFSSGLKPTELSLLEELQSKKNMGFIRYDQLHSAPGYTSTLSSTDQSAPDSDENYSYYIHKREPKASETERRHRSQSISNMHGMKTSNALSDLVESTEHKNSATNAAITQNSAVTVSKRLTVLPADLILAIDDPYSNESQPYCFSPVKFTVIISCLLFLVLCLLIACILLTLNIKRMNRNNSISRFLLYPYN